MVKKVSSDEFRIKGKYSQLANHIKFIRCYLLKNSSTRQQ